MTLKDKVEAILKQYPTTRNCDQRLAHYVWYMYHRELIDMTDEKNPKVAIKDLYELPRLQAISRIRRKFTESGMYLPTDPGVFEARKIKQEYWTSFAKRES